MRRQGSNHSQGPEELRPSKSKEEPNRAEEQPATPNASSKSGGQHDFHDWQFDSSFDSKNLTSTRDLDNFLAMLGGPIPLADMAAQHKPFAKQMQGEIDTYLRGNNKDMQAKCEIAQDILRHGIERSPELIDEMYLQLLRHLRGSNRSTSVRGWELLLLAACASRPSAQFLEPVNNFVHSTSHAKVQWPTTVSILAKRTWTALKHNSKPGRRVNVPSVGEIANVLSSRAMKVQITFVDGSNKWLFYDWTTTVSSAVEQLASQIGLKNYTDYTLFEVRKVPKKLDTDGSGSVATLPPDSYLLLDDNRRIADVLHDYEVRGAQNKLLLKRKRFDASEADFSKPQFIALTEAHQGAMDEKVAEVANLTLRLREMSSRVMWFEAQQGEHRAEIDSMKEQLEATEAHARELEARRVSVDAKHVVAERDQLVAKVRQLEAAAAARVAGQRRKSLDQAVEEEGGEWKPLGLIRKLAQKQDELRQTQVELDALQSLATPADVQKASRIAQQSAEKNDALPAVKPDLHSDVEAEMSEKEALYDLLRLQNVMEDEQAEEITAKDKEIEHLKQTVEALARRQSKSFGTGGRVSLENRGSAQHDDSRELRKSLDSGALSNAPGVEEQLEIVTAASIVMEAKLGNVQDALDAEISSKNALEAEIVGLRRQLQSKDTTRGQDREVRAQLNALRADAAAARSKLKSREAALDQATADLDDLHRESAKLRSDLETKEWELECANSSLVAAVAERDAAAAIAKQLKQRPGEAIFERAPSGDVGKQMHRKEQEVSHLTEQLVAIVAERDAALEKLAGIQQLMFGMGGGMGGKNAADSFDLPSRRMSIDREGKAKNINDNCPLQIGRDPRRESIGGASAPMHLKGAPPLRVLPEEKRSYGTRHPLFAPNYVGATSTPEKTESRSGRPSDVAAVLSAADARRRLHRKAAPSERPAPHVQTTPRMTNRINTGTHLLGLLSNMAITQSHDSIAETEDTVHTSDGARGDLQSTNASDLLKTSSSMASQEQPAKGEGRGLWNSGGALSTHSDHDNRRLQQTLLKPED